MGYKKPNRENSEPIDFPRYTNQELETFGASLDKFREEKEIKWKGEDIKTNLINIEEAMVEFGAMKKKMHLGQAYYSIILKPLETDDYGNIVRYEKPTKYELFNQKYQSWVNLKGRRQFAGDKAMEDYSKMAEQLVEEKSIQPEQIEF